jgi:hypothetical protein
MTNNYDKAFSFNKGVAFLFFFEEEGFGNWKREFFY